MRPLLFVFMISLFFHNSGAFAQQELVVVERAKNRSIPDPESPLALASLLANKSVMADLGLNLSDKEELAKLLLDNKGSLTLYQTRDNISREELMARGDEYRAANMAKLMEVIDPNQLVRLRQIAYHIEIQRVGLREALTAGCLGSTLKVTEDQIGAINIYADSAETQFVQDSDRIKRLVWKTLLEKLTEEQKVELDAMFGPLFNFADEPYLKTDGYAIPDPENELDLVLLTKNKSIARELDMTREMVEDIASVYRENSGAVAKAMAGFRGTKEDRQAIIESINEISRKALAKTLSRKKLIRLRQVAFQVEAERMGLSRAMLAGRLAKYLKLSDEQQSKIREVSESVEKELSVALVKVRGVYNQRIFRGLDPSQRDQTELVLGKSLIFVEEPVFSGRRNKPK